jgi:hypothetical protein
MHYLGWTFLYQIPSLIHAHRIKTTDDDDGRLASLLFVMYLLGVYRYQVLYMNLVHSVTDIPGTSVTRCRRGSLF